MTSQEGLLTILDALEKAGIPSLVVGSLSSTYYGIARSTKDANFVIQLDTHRLASLFDSLGPSFRLDP